MGFGGAAGGSPGSVVGGAAVERALLLLLGRRRRLADWEGEAGRVHLLKHRGERGGGLGKGPGEEESSPDTAAAECAGQTPVGVGRGEGWAGAAGQLGLGPVRFGGKAFF